jgi:hypothetical protein
MNVLIGFILNFFVFSARVARWYPLRAYSYLHQGRQPEPEVDAVRRACGCHLD